MRTVGSHAIRILEIFHGRFFFLVITVDGSEMILVFVFITHTFSSYNSYEDLLWTSLLMQLINAMLTPNTNSNLREFPV